MNDWLDQFVICCCQWVSFLGCYLQIWNMLKPPTSLWTSPKYSLSLQPHSLYHWLILSIYRIHSTPLLVLKSCEITLFSVNSWKYIYTMDTDTTNSEQRVWVKKNVPSSFPLGALQRRPPRITGISPASQTRKLRTPWTRPSGSPGWSAIMEKIDG